MDSVSVARPGERHGAVYNTADEIDFLDDIPRLMSIRAGGKETPRKQTDVLILGQYRQYQDSCKNRKDWGGIEKPKAVEHCKKLMLRYARRAHKGTSR